MSKESCNISFLNSQHEEFIKESAHNNYGWKLREYNIKKIAEYMYIIYAAKMFLGKNINVPEPDFFLWYFTAFLFVYFLV